MLLFKLKIMVGTGTPFTQTAEEVVLCGYGGLGKASVEEARERKGKAMDVMNIKL